MSIKEQLLAKHGDRVIEVEHKAFDGTVKRVVHVHRGESSVRNVNRELEGSFSLLNRAAVVVTARVGTFGFFLIILTWTVLWLGWNLVGPAGARFDPAPAFVLWLFVSNMIQIMLMPLIMIGQNLQGRHSELRAEADFEVNKRAEQEIEDILLHLEHQAAELERQGELILSILAKLGGDDKAASAG